VTCILPGGERLILFQIVLSAKGKKQMYLSKEHHLLRKQEDQVHCFPVRIHLLFEMNPSCNFGVSMWRKPLFTQIGIFS
jgi:hypothetical protein